MDREQHRLSLQAYLQSLVKKFVGEKDKTSHVYYNPPTGFQLEFPCFVYKDTVPSVQYADNQKYFYKPAWEVTTMTRDPKSADIAPLIEFLPQCRYNTSFRSDGIAHRVYTLYW